MNKVKVLRPFNATPQGGLVDVGDEIDVADVRAEELVLLGLAERLHARKAAPAPENKMAPEPLNKAAAGSEKQMTTVSRTKRRARPVK
ncbi:hypothetical protein AAII07_54345 [Microvirga sp. 0TCS3.31]